MSSYYQRECAGCGLPCVGFYCYQCTCQQCGVNFINEVCLNCTNGDGKPFTCCVCEGPLNGGFCSFCASRAGNSFAYDPNSNSFNDSPSVFTHPPQLQFETYLCELYGNNAHYGYDCPPQFPLVYEQEPCHNQNFNDNYFPQNSQSSSQQYICCQNCGGPHATFECQPMSQNLYNSNSSGFDQFQPPQFPVIHQPPQETSAEILQARENLMNSIQTFLKKFNRISFRETPKVLTRAWEKFFEIQHAQPEDIQELLHKLLKDLQIISEELAEYINLPRWNRPAYYYEVDDEEYTIATTPDLPTEKPDNSLIEDIDYVDASPPDSELVSLEEVKDFDPEDGEIDTDILLTIKEISSSGNPTSHSDLSLPDYEAFYCDSEPDSGNFTIDVVNYTFVNPTREPRVHVPNVLPTQPTLYLDSDFASSDDSLRFDLVVSFSSGTRNKIFNLGIFIEVQSKRFLSPNEFSISFIHDPLSSVFDTLLPFLSKNEEKVFNPGSLSSNEEKSPHLLSHRSFNPSKIISDFFESPMMISGGDIPILDVPCLYFYPP
ncbi:hypothetical protein Tco_0110288 [Tanacetum coccineum]